MEIPDGFEQKPLTDMQRFNGSVLRAENNLRHESFMVTSKSRAKNPDIHVVSRGVRANIGVVTENPKISAEEDLTIDGLKAVRFEAEAKNKGVFGATFTYVVTVLEGSQEIIVINGWAPTKADFSAEREDFRHLAYLVKGLVLPVEAASQQENSSATPGSRGPGSGTSTSVASPPSTEANATTAPVAVSAAPSPVISASPNAPSADRPSSAARSGADRLRDLEKLCKEGVVADSDCVVKKKELLGAL